MVMIGSREVAPQFRIYLNIFRYIIVTRILVGKKFSASIIRNTLIWDFQGYMVQGFDIRYYPLRILDKHVEIFAQKASA